MKLKKIFTLMNIYENNEKYKLITILNKNYKFIINMENSLKKYPNPINKKLKIKNYQPSFSVIMATYNRGYCICDAIDSYLNQTYTNAELIIIDDGSTDNTENIIKTNYANSIKNGKIKYIKQQNTGQTIARNIAYKHCQKDYICFLDSDNVMLPNYLETFAKCIVSNMHKNIFYAVIKQYTNNNIYLVGKPFNYNELSSGNNYIDLNVLCLKKEFIEKQELLFDKNLKSLEDYELILRYTIDEPPIFVPLVLVNYYAKSQNRVTNKIDIQNDLLYLYKKHNIFSGITISTIITSYNHEKYIEKAIKSAIEQTGNFTHQIIISDDGSTDNTHEIIAKYAKMYPEFIEDISSKNNLGISENMRKALTYAKGKYISILEGDDYWLSRSKLQQQLDFLEKNKDVSLCYVRVEALDQNTQNKFFFKKHQNKKYIKAKGKDLFYKKQILNRCITFSACMYRAELLKNLPEILFSERFSEVALMFYLENYGKIGYVPINGTQYRIHSNGVWSGKTEYERLKDGLTTTKISKEVANIHSKKILDKVIKYESELLKNYEDS